MDPRFCYRPASVIEGRIDLLNALTEEPGVDIRPKRIDVLHILQFLIFQAVPGGKIFGCPEEFLEPLVVMMKPLIRILLGLGRKQKKGPVTSLQQKELKGQLANDAMPPFIGRCSLTFEQEEYLFHFPRAGIDVRPNPAVVGILPDGEIRVQPPCAWTHFNGREAGFIAVDKVT